MVLEYDLDKLNVVLGDFYRATGVNINLFNENFEPVRINKYPPPDYCRTIQMQNRDTRPCHGSDVMLLKRCQAEKKLVMHICHAGLLDVAVPILYEDNILGYIMFGQIRTGMEFPEVKEKILHLHLNMEEMEGFYGRLRYIDDDTIRSIASIAEILARHIMLENMMKPMLYSGIERAAAYIRANLYRSLSIRDICAHTHLSASALYHQFHKHFGCTVSEYINARRVEKAAELLEKTMLSIEDISEQLGFSDATYFSRVFKQTMGVPPVQYRKRLREKEGNSKKT